MQKKKVSFRHRTEYAFLQLFLALIKITPDPLLKSFRLFLAASFRILGSRHRRVVGQNITTAFPELSESESRKLINNVYRHFSGVFLEIINVFASRKREKVLAKVTINGIDIIHRVLEKGRGVIVFSAHLGNWEWIPFILSHSMEKPIFSMAKEMRNPLVEKKVLEFRSLMGSHIINKDGAIRTTLKMLAENKMVLMLIDQNVITREGIFVDFFSRKANVVTSVSRLHLRNSIPIVPLFVHYEGDRIILDIMEEIEYSGTEEEDRDLIGLTTHCTRLIEGHIRRYPEQWFWFHDRWRTRPEGEINAQK